MPRHRRNPAEAATETLSVKLTPTEMKALDSWQEAGLTRTTAVVKALTLLGTPSSKPPVPSAVIEALARPLDPTPFKPPPAPTGRKVLPDVGRDEKNRPKVTKATPASACIGGRGTQRAGGVIVCKACGKPYAEHLR
jgi:hypothetical protein